MRIGLLLEVEKPLDEIVEQASVMAERGIDSGWAVQIFGHDPLTLLAVVGDRVPGLALGTSVVPVHPRHPQALAQQALTAQQACGGRLTLGVGLSHQMVVEGLWGYSYERPSRYMKEYLAALLPMLQGEAVDAGGEMVRAVLPQPLAIEAPPPPVLVAALGPVMLRLAGEVAQGTVTWMTGIRTVGDHIVPRIAEAASAAGRPRPQVVVSLPVTITGDAERAKDHIDRSFALYPHLPSYKAMLDREGAAKPSDVSLVGSEQSVSAALDRLEQAGATEFVASTPGTREERTRTEEFLAARAAGRA